MGDFLKLRKIYKSLEDGVCDKAEFFEPRHEPEKIKREVRKATKAAPMKDDAELSSYRKQAVDMARDVIAIGGDLQKVIGMSIEDIEKESDKVTLANKLDCMTEWLMVEQMQQKDLADL
jgi:DMSO/TMAO reductase YedYZ molybdopterin-dependent catalytic subunit